MNLQIISASNAITSLIFISIKQNTFYKIELKNIHKFNKNIKYILTQYVKEIWHPGCTNRFSHNQRLLHTPDKMNNIIVQAWTLSYLPYSILQQSLTFNFTLCIYHDQVTLKIANGHTFYIYKTGDTMPYIPDFKKYATSNTQSFIVSSINKVNCLLKIFKIKHSPRVQYQQF